MANYADQLQTFSLNGAGAVSGATSITLKSMIDIDGTPVTMAAFGTKGFGTLEPGNGNLEEQISFTGISQNSNGTATLTGVKSVLMAQPFTESSGLMKTHAGSTIFVISNTSGFYNLLAFKDNNETITGYYNFPSPLANANPATKEYVDDLVSGGTVTNSAVIVVGTAGETVSTGQLVYLSSSDGRWYKASASASATIDLLNLGITQGAGTTGNVITGGVLVKGVDTNQSGLVAGTIYYAGNTAGSIGSSVGTVERAIGQGVTATTLYFDPYFFYIPTANQKAALAGTSTPSASNKYVNQAELKFGGTGADGALSITSGVTTIDLANVQIVTKNYTSISITGTGSLAFSNPNSAGSIVILKSQGNVTVTSSASPAISAVGIGAPGGTAGSGTGPTAGGNGTAGYGPKPFISSGLGAGGGGAVSGTGTGGSAGTIASPTLDNTYLSVIRTYGFVVGAGGGGGGGGSNSNGGGAGGAGGGVLIIQCAGALNKTSDISAAGAAGNAADAGTPNQGAGGGGGGGGGTLYIFYNSLTANSGATTVTGGVGGSGRASSGGGTAAGGGGGGGSNTAGTAGTAGNGSTGGAGGAGGNGVSLVMQNTLFV